MISRNSVISIYGLYLFDPHLFDGFECPDGLDRDLVIDSIVMENAELELLYPDGDFMKGMIRLWSKKEQEVWQKQLDALRIEYNPLWNKDGTVEETRNIKSTAEGKGTDTLKVSAYNEAGYHNKQENGSESSSSGDTDETFTRKEYGNIGVTTSQAMLKEELEVRKNNIIDFIVTSFKKRFCLLIY